MRTVLGPDSVLFRQRFTHDFARRSDEIMATELGTLVADEGEDSGPQFVGMLLIWRITQVRLAAVLFFLRHFWSEITLS